MPEEFEFWVLQGSSGEYETYDEWYVSEDDGAISWFPEEGAAAIVGAYLNQFAKDKNAKMIKKLDGAWAHTGSFTNLGYIVLKLTFRQGG